MCVIESTKQIKKKQKKENGANELLLHERILMNDIGKIENKTTNKHKLSQTEWKIGIMFNNKNNSKQLKYQIEMIDYPLFFQNMNVSYHISIRNTDNDNDNDNIVLCDYRFNKIQRLTKNDRMIEINMLPFINMNELFKKNETLTIDCWIAINQINDIPFHQFDFFQCMCFALSCVCVCVCVCVCALCALLFVRFCAINFDRLTKKKYKKQKQTKKYNKNDFFFPL